MIAVRFHPAAPLSGDVVTLDGREYLIERRAVRLSEVTDRFEAFEVQVRPLARASLSEFRGTAAGRAGTVPQE